MQYRQATVMRAEASFLIEFRLVSEVGEEGEDEDDEEEEEEGAG